MDDSNIADIARHLSDLEVALFLCLVAREHCLIETTSHCISDLAKELALVCLMSRFIKYQFFSHQYRLPQLLLIIHIVSLNVPPQLLLRTFTMMFSLPMHARIIARRVLG